MRIYIYIYIYIYLIVSFILTIPLTPMNFKSNTALTIYSFYPFSSTDFFLFCPPAVGNKSAC